jgi:hypothetical protein
VSRAAGYSPVTFAVVDFSKMSRFSYDGLPMKTRTQTRRLTCLVLCLIATLGSVAAAQTSGRKAIRQSDVIYGRKFGVALTMEVFTAATRNGIGVVWVVSSNGRSSRDQTLQESFERRIAPLLDRGYTVFAIIHGSAPIFNVQDQVSDGHLRGGIRSAPEGFDLRAKVAIAKAARQMGEADEGLEERHETRIAEAQCRDPLGRRLRSAVGGDRGRLG